ncbi:transketolase C-terminal domain-containing protein [Halobacteriaceae archaeon GCM10025711]
MSEAIRREEREEAEQSEDTPEGAHIMTGTGAVARAVRDIGVDVVSAYPITPQTEIVEDIAEYVETDALDAQFSRVESEHSALATVMGASQANARTFTATASQGLLYMSEMVWWTAGARLPVVMAVANRALGPAWNIWGSHTDALSQRDSGWVQTFAANVQEAYDLTLVAYRIAEDHDVMLPGMVNLDGFTLAHTMQPLTAVDPDDIQTYLGDIDVPHKIDMESPRGYGAMAGGADFWRFRKKMMDAMDRVPAVAERAFEEFAELTGREYSLVHEYRTDDADVVLVGLGTLTREAEVAADVLREEHGVKAGVVRPLLYTPFPDEAFRAAVGDAEKVVVLDRATSFGRGGIVTRDVRLALDRPVAGVLAGIGGQNVDYNDVVRIALEAEPGETQWFGGDIE